MTHLWRRVEKHYSEHNHRNAKDGDFIDLRCETWSVCVRPQIRNCSRSIPLPIPSRNCVSSTTAWNAAFDDSCSWIFRFQITRTRARHTQTTGTHSFLCFLCFFLCLCLLLLRLRDVSGLGEYRRVIDTSTGLSEEERQWNSALVFEQKIADTTNWIYIRYFWNSRHSALFSLQNSVVKLIFLEARDLFDYKRVNFETISVRSTQHWFY